jgi:hypothetical protein
MPIIQTWRGYLQTAGLTESSLLQVPAQHEHPVLAFLHLEGRIAQNLLEQVNTDLLGIEKVILGNSSATSHLAKVGADLLASTTPDAWSTIWSSTDDATAWMRSAANRIVALHGMWSRVTLESIAGALQGGFSLSSFFRPTTFLNALRQTAAQAGVGPLDDLKLTAIWEGVPPVCAVPDAVLRAGSARISGLQLSGVGWDAGRGMVDSKADAGELTPLPTAHLVWLAQDAADPYPAKEALTTPLYRAMDREETITRLPVPIGAGSLVKWVLSGVALVTSDL